MEAFCPYSCFPSEYSVAVAVTDISFPKAGSRIQNAFSFQVFFYLGKKIFLQSPLQIFILQIFILNLIRRYWFTREPERPGKGEWGEQCLGKIYCVP